MAQWNPPQPVWKRNLAGLLDFLLAFIALGYLLTALGFGTWMQGGFVLGPWPSLVLVGIIVMYFTVLGRTGGTVFQRLFRMRRAAAGEPRVPLAGESPLWKHNLAGGLDCLLALIVFTFLLARLGFAKPPPMPQGSPGINLEGGPALVLFAYVIAYFVGLRRAGGTVFQRLLRVKRKGGAVWDPPQPAWKRYLAATLDVVLAAIGFGAVLWLSSAFPAHDVEFNIPWQMMLLPALIVGYFAVLGSSGGTVFQRLFGMKRGKLREEDDKILQQF